EEVGELERLQAPNAGDVVPLARMDAQDLDVLVLRLQEPAAAGDRAARAEARDKVGDLAVGLPPDFRSRGAEVGVRIGGVLVLVELVPARLLTHLEIGRA